MKHLKLAFAIVAIMLLASCKKDYTTQRYSGIVLTVENNEPIADVSVQLLELRDPHDYGSGKKVAETTTNKDGNFEFNFDAKRDKTYLLMYSKPGYFDQYTTSDILYKVVTMSKIPMKPLEINFVKVNQVDSAHFIFHYTYAELPKEITVYGDTTLNGNIDAGLSNILKFTMIRDDREFNTSVPITENKAEIRY